MEDRKRDNNKRYRVAVSKALLMLAVLVAIVSILVWAQAYDYVRVFAEAKINSSEKLEKNSEQAMADLESKLGMLVSPTQSETSQGAAETENDGQTGQTKDDELAQIQQSSSSEKAAQPDYSKEFEQHYTILERLKSDFTSELGSIVQSAKDEYAALPGEERTNDNKIKIVMAKKSELEALEAKCDAQVESEANAIRSLLTISGQDISLADEILEAYENLKEAKKTEYINKLYT